MTIVWGCATIVICMAVQCVVVSLLLHWFHVLGSKYPIDSRIFPAATTLIVVLLILFGGNLVQMSIWAGLFLAWGEFQDFGTAFYHSVVNFSTLGYGDLVMSPSRRLLGALEAANGVMMLGLSTSVLYSVLRAMMDRKLRRLKNAHEVSAPNAYKATKGSTHENEDP